MIQKTLRTFARSHVGLALSAATAVAAVGTFSRAASAGDVFDTVQVTVKAPSRKGCISSEKLKKAVQKRVKGVPRNSEVDVQIEATDEDSGWVADVSVPGQSAKRSVKTKSASCAKLNDGLVLVVALLLDPTEEEEMPAPAPPPKGDDPESAPPGGSWSDDPSEEEEEVDNPKPSKNKPGAPLDEPGNTPQPESGKKPPSSKPGKGNEPSDKPESDEPESDGDKGGAGKGGKDKGGDKGKVQFGFGASAVYAAGLAPNGILGVRGSFFWLSPTPVPLEASFTYYQEVTQYGWNFGSDYARQAATFSAGLTSCPANLKVGRLHFGACAGMSVTRIAQQITANGAEPPAGEYYEPYYSQSEDYIFSPTADLRFDITLWKALRIGAGVEVSVPVNRPDPVLFDTGYVMNGIIEPVIFQSRLGITLVLPP